MLKSIFIQVNYFNENLTLTIEQNIFNFNYLRLQFHLKFKNRHLNQKGYHNTGFKVKAI